MLPALKDALHGRCRHQDDSPCTWLIGTPCVACVAEMLQGACIAPRREHPSSLLQVTPLCHEIRVLWCDQTAVCSVPTKQSVCGKIYGQGCRCTGDQDRLIKMLAMHADEKSHGSRFWYV